MRDVKSRPGSVRAERAVETRQRVEAAARALFATRGYGATTLREIAEAARVSIQTVYAVYGSKAGILHALREALRDDPEADAAYETALSASDNDRALTAFARSIRRRWEAGQDIVTMHVEAASVDPEVRTEVASMLEGRRRGIRQLAQSLADRSPDRGDVARVAAVLDALTLPELYTELVGVHGWRPADYERWLAATLIHALADAETWARSSRTT